MPSDAASAGILPISGTQGTIDLSTDLPTFENAPLARQCERTLTAEWTEFTLRSARLADQTFIVTWRFNHQSLHAIELVLQQTDDGTSWSDWTEEKERRRKSASEAWVNKTFHTKMVVKPFEFEGKLITPFEVLWDTPLCAQFPWGEITSFYDSKGGSSGLILRRKN